MERRLVTTNRDVAARLVPTGDEITIADGTFVTLTQALGGTYTVVIEGNMARIAGSDADAIGLEKEILEFEDTEQVPNETHVWHALASVYDPEIPVNIVDLGLVYDVRIDAAQVRISMTLTAPGCGMGPVLVAEVKDRVGMAPGIDDVEVNLVFEPVWSREMMSEEAQLELGMF